MLFFKPATGSGKLVLGDAPAGGSTPALDFSIDADFADAPPELHLAYGVTCAIDAAFDDGAALPADLQLAWDANVSRSTRAPLQSVWQGAAPLRAALSAHWQQAQALRLATIVRWQTAQPARAALDAHWQDTERLRHVARVHWQQAALLRAALDPAWQETEHLRASLRAHHQQADLLRGAAMLHWQDTLRLRHAARTHWQQGAAHRAAHRTRYRDALRQHISTRCHWQEAWRPRSGVSGTPQPPEKHLCYDPATLGQLVFDAAYTGTGALLFVCRRAGGVTPPEPPHYLIPLLEVYMSTHSLSAVLLPSLEPVLLLDFSIDSDDGGYGWALSATGPEHLLDQLAPGSGGVPVQVRVTIDGHNWVFAIERISRTRRFGQHRCSIEGHSLTALLGAPWLPEQTWLNGAQISAHQAVLDALQYTGATTAWNLTDWLLPAGTWSFTGTPLAAALRMAEAAGAVLRSHATDLQLIFAPSYPVMPWDWASAAANLELPAAIITTDGLDPDPRPPANQVYVSGQAQGVLAQVRRYGSAGDVLAPQVVDALITDVEAARQRGKTVLASAGNKLQHTMTLPFLTGALGPGPVLPGWLLQVNDIGHTWRGLVRSIHISAGLPTVRQSVQVERIAETIP